MRIAFVLPIINLTGGIKEPLEYANQLQSLGHDVVVVYPRKWPHPDDTVRRNAPWSMRAFDYLRREATYYVKHMRGQSELDWFDLQARLYRIPELAEDHLPDGDAIIAVDWTTAEFVSGCAPQKGRKFYLIQGYETFCGPQDRVDATWRLPLSKIVISSWLWELSIEKFGEKPAGLLVPGIKFDEFFPDKQSGSRTRRIGMRFHNLPYKAIPDGLAAIEMVRKHHPDIQLVMFSTNKPESGLPEGVEFYVRPTQSELRRIYSSCAIWLVPSHMEGAGLPGQEAMACGCALVTTDVGAVRDYSIPGETALVSSPGDVSALATNLLRLLDDEDYLRSLARAGTDYVRQFTWERATSDLLRLLQAEV